jgi:hypothetical protein
MVVKPHGADAPVNITSPIRYSTRRPYMSARLAAVSRNDARVSA